jgi:hypothetical protein
MTFIEVHPNEDKSELKEVMCDAYAALYRQAPPNIGFAQAIAWHGRIFQEVQLPKGPNAFEHENEIFYCWNLPDDRARIQVGSMRGEVFTTPPEAASELSARVHEAGRCGKEYVVRPFHYSDYDE